MIDTVIGTGGIGTGVVYLLDGCRTLGRNESRMGSLLGQKDFCKLHIVLHYVASLAQRPLKVYPVGAVGEDEQGFELKRLMEKAGMDLKYVRSLKGARTLSSVCFQYPDRSGGNITQKNSASDRVSPLMIKRAATAFSRGRTLVVALPEVPLESRAALLELGRKHRSFNAASFNSAELKEAKGLEMVDLLSINIDEAARLGRKSSCDSPGQIVRACARKAWQMNPAMKLCISNGRHGLFGAENGRITALPGLKVKVKNTAGAGDALLAGLIIGLVRGIPFMSCLEIGRNLSARSVESADTINFGIKRI